MEGKDGDGSLTDLQAVPCMDTDSEGRSQKKTGGDGALNKHLELAFVRKQEFAPWVPKEQGLPGKTVPSL